MNRVSRNAPCPCGSGRKFKRCCLPTSSAGPSSNSALREIETIDATGRGCRWTTFKREGPEGSARGEIVEHLCTGDRFEVDAPNGWLRNGESVSMLFALDALPPQLAGWALQQALDAATDEEPTPLGVELARVLLLAGAVLEVIGETRESSPGRLRRTLPLRRRRTAA